jgi:hypothetical protein
MFVLILHPTAHSIGKIIADIVFLLKNMASLYGKEVMNTSSSFVYTYRLQKDPIICIKQSTHVWSY